MTRSATVPADESLPRSPPPASPAGFGNTPAKRGRSRYRCLGSLPSKILRDENRGSSRRRGKKARGRRRGEAPPVGPQPHLLRKYRIFQQAAQEAVLRDDKHPNCE